MGVPGPKPRDAALTRHRNKPTHDWVEVIEVPHRGGPSLPDKQPGGDPWPAWTRRWWKTVSTMPHCKLWRATDWEFAFDTAALKAEFHTRGGNTLATEIRNRERVLGTTAEYRRDLRIRYIPAQAVTRPSPVTDLDAYRDL